MKLRQLPWLTLFGLSLIVLITLLPGLTLAQEVVTVQLDPVGESGVSGTATLTAEGDGTHVVLAVEGLAPDAAARAVMQSNTCAQPSASFAAMPDLQADANGRATATGSILFRGTAAIALATITDGEHIVVILTDQMAACGVIPAATAPSTPSALPVSGGTKFPLMTVAASILGVGALLAGLWLRRRL